ncbi:NAD(P) transhydrogenase subunit alpha [Desulfitispora alkaliphila]|uniref:NAD(P) transhydrogenase subunit alpha n=1 Tax=Desulfitispora alkaliphila TaxID=622674 RepID=UPI003D25F13C
MNFKGLKIGVPKEIMKGEARVSATPETVKKIVSEGGKVFIEKGAGEGAFFLDEDYEAAGGEIINDCEKIFAQADIILKVKEPQFNENKGKHETEMMQPGQCLITFIHPANPENHQMVKDIAEKGVVALTLDGIPRISRAQAMDALTSMSTVAGYKSVLIAANKAGKFMPMVGTAVGMLKPANILVIGTGVAGLQAVATAKRLGAVVTAADIRPAAQEQATSLGAKNHDLGVPEDVAVGQGGYANKISEEWLKKERELLKEKVASSDIVILTALIPGALAPLLVTEEMVKSMAPGSVIVDVAIDQGGNCEVTAPGKIITKYGVTIDGTKNIPGMMPTTATRLLSNNIYNYLKNLVAEGKVNINEEDEIIKSSLVTRDKKIVHAGTLEAMNDVELKEKGA